MYQYTVATNTWKAIASLPTDHGNNGSCTVSGDGWLYVGTGSNLTFYRLQLY
jgi:glucose/arabinose dehydrogenase